MGQMMKDASIGQKVAGLLGLGALIVLIGSFLPWASFSASGLGQDSSETTGGLDTDDGKLFLGFAVALLIGAAIAWRGASRTVKRVIGVVGILLGLLIAIGAANDISELDDALGTVGNLESLGIEVSASTGIGLYMAMVGGIVIIVGALWMTIKPGEAGSGPALEADAPASAPPPEPPAE